MSLPLTLHIIQIKTPRSHIGFDACPFKLPELFDMIGLPSLMKISAFLFHHIPLIPDRVIAGCLQPLYILDLFCPITLLTYIPWYQPQPTWSPTTTASRWILPIARFYSYYDDPSGGAVKSNDILVLIALWNNYITCF